MERVGEVLSTKGNSVPPKVGAAEGEDGTTVEIVWKVVVAEGEEVATVGKVVTSTPVLPGVCGAGAAVKTTDDTDSADGELFGVRSRGAAPVFRPRSGGMNR